MPQRKNRFFRIERPATPAPVPQKQRPVLIPLSIGFGLIFVSYLAGKTTHQLTTISTKPSKNALYQEKPGQIVAEGKIIDILYNPWTFVFVGEKNQKEIRARVSDSSRFYDSEGKQISPDLFQIGALVEADISSQNSTFTLTSVKLLKVYDSVLTSPAYDDVVSENLIVSGKTLVNAETLALRLQNSRTGKSVYEKVFTLDDKLRGKYQNFQFVVNLPPVYFDLQDNDHLNLLLFQENLQGKQFARLESRVIFHSSPVHKVRYYFPRGKDREVCSIIAPVVRDFRYTSHSIEDILVALTRELTDKDTEKGFRYLNQNNYLLNKAEFRDGTLHLDLNKKMFSTDPDTCVLKTLVSQLATTFGQFPGIGQVIVTLDNKTIGE